MKILVLEFNASSKVGGAEKSMRNFCEFISEEHSIYLGYHFPGELVNDSHFSCIYKEIISLNLCHLTFRNLFRWLNDWWKIFNFIRKNEIELIISHLVHISPLLRVLGITNNIKYSIYYKWVCSFDNVGAKVKWGNKSIQFSAAVSKFVADYWIKNGINLKRISVVPEGTSTQILRNSNSFAINSISIGYAGRIVPEKGIEDLITALGILHSKNLAATLRIAGEFNGASSKNQNLYHLQLERKIQHLRLEDFIFFDGFVYPLEPWFSKINLLVVPSTCQDAQPLVMMQAMSTGTPVIGTNVGGIPEILKGEFESLLIPPNRPELMASKIADWGADVNRLKAIGRKMCHYVTINFTMEKHFRDLTRALNIK